MPAAMFTSPGGFRRRGHPRGPDHLLGAILGARTAFNELLAPGFRILDGVVGRGGSTRGESLRNLEAFARWSVRATRHVRPERLRTRPRGIPDRR